MKALFFLLIMLVTFAGFNFKNDPIAAEVVNNQKSRIKDAWGSGQFLSPRDKGKRAHQGLDIEVKPEEKIFSPITGNIIRPAMPYKNDSSYTGIVLSGTGEWVGYEIRIYYVSGILSGKVRKGQEIGFAQNLTLKYPGIKNHIHIEVKKVSIQIDPFELWQMSF